MSRRAVFRAVAAVVIVLALAAEGLWLVYGEAVGVLQGLVTAEGDAPPPGVMRTPLAIERDGTAVIADAYASSGAEPRATLVLVPGLTPSGRRDRRVVGVSGVLARAGFRVVVPDLPGAKGLRVGDEDVAVLKALLDQLAARRGGRPLGMVAISYGLGPALAAAAAPARANALDLVVGLGGYYDARDVIAFTTTGAYRGPHGRPRTGTPDPRARWLLLASAADDVVASNDRLMLRALAERGFEGHPPTLVAIAQLMAVMGPDARALLALVVNTDPKRVDRLIDDLAAPQREALLALSPSRLDLSALAGKLLLVHGEKDPVVPYTESVRLAAKVPGTRLILVPGFSHVDPQATGLAGRIAMVRAVKILLDLRR